VARSSRTPCSWPSASTRRARDRCGARDTLSEAEVQRWDLVAGLQARGVRKVISEAHAGLKPDRDARLSGVSWQRCQFHPLKDALAFLPRPSLRPQVVASLRLLFDAPARAEAERQLEIALRTYRTSAPNPTGRMEANVPRADGVRPAAGASTATADLEQAGAAERGDQVADEGGGAVRERRLGPSAASVPS
jgi:hypothetical protein